MTSADAGGRRKKKEFARRGHRPRRDAGCAACPRRETGFPRKDKKLKILQGKCIYTAYAA
ncbi:MAG: hypothetical protein DBX63_00090 [Clostridia bacterium]|nr:MAG: hypothetical protein DBX63_00090 [Clostridia bacterium]